MTSSVRVLIADDHSVVRAGLRALLEHHSNLHVVGEATNGEEAVEKARELKPDVAVLDIRMPKLSGIEACKQIVDSVPNCRVIVLTTYAEDELLFSAIRAGASGYVLKRIGDNDLVNAVERVSRGENILDPTMMATVFSEMRKLGESQQSAAFADLTAQELMVLAHVAHGQTNRQIAGALFLGEGTVRNYVSSVLAKLNLSNRAEAAAYAVTHHIDEVLPPAAAKEV